MKKFAKTSVLLIIAVTIFFTGIGVTVINFCCPSCSEQTLVMAKQHTCCTQKGIDSSFDKKCCCSVNAVVQKESCGEKSYTNGMHCSSSRLSIDIDASSFRPHVSNPFVWISDAQLYSIGATQTVGIYYAEENWHFKVPPNILPREYLSLIRILII